MRPFGLLPFVVAFCVTATASTNSTVTTNQQDLATESNNSIVVTDEMLGPVPTSVAVGMEDVNHEIYGGIYTQMIFGEAFAEPAQDGISGMWRATDSAHNVGYSLTEETPFKGTHSQRIERKTAGNWSGIENRGLNRQGMSIVAEKPYEGKIALRSDVPIRVRLSFQSEDGASVIAQQTIESVPNGWHNYPINLIPSKTEYHARFAIEISTPGALDVGYAFVQPGSWGRYKDVPVRGDVAHAMIDQGLQAIRFGGCANGGCGDVSEYKWKAMIGDPMQRPITRGFWYPYESNGFGIFEFLQLGEALNIEAVPSLNIDETPADIHDLMDYLYGSAETEWGRHRIADGHPTPYKVHRFELGNEFPVDDTYFAKFKTLADVIWSYDSTIRLVVGDFTYQEVIHNPFDFTGGGKVKSLEAHQKILELASHWGAEVDFDVHLWTAGSDEGGSHRKSPDLSSQIVALDSYAEALRSIGPKGVKFKVVVFELNADTHDLARALANAYTITALQRRPYIDVVSSANAFQLDGQNDNDWNQGLIFMDQASVWFQPPFYVHQMIANSQREQVVRADVSGGDKQVEATAFRDSKGTSLNIVNISSQPLSYEIDFGRRARGANAEVTTLGGVRGTAVNTSENPVNIIPETAHRNLDDSGRMRYELPPRSFTTIQILN